MEKTSFRDEIRYNPEDEFESILDGISAKYGYDEELKRVLLQIYQTGYKNSSFEMRQNFIQTLKEVPIVILDEITEEKLKELYDQYLGKNRIEVILEKARGKYASTLGKGAYCTTPVLDEDGNLIERKSFIYVTRLEPIRKEVIDRLGTNIHVPHLIHELGHAQAARKDEYVQEGNKIVQRCGTLKKEFTVTQFDGKPALIEGRSKGIYLEEALNTVWEYENVAKFLGVEPSEVDNLLYRGAGIYGLAPSTYHGLMDFIGERMQGVIGDKQIEQVRMFNFTQVLEEFNKLAASTEYWKDGIHSEEEMKKKRGIFEAPKSKNWKEFLQDNEGTYLSINASETPIEKLDNVLQQIYDMSMVKYSIPIEEYKTIAQSIIFEACILLNQADRIKTREAEREV